MVKFIPSEGEGEEKAGIEAGIEAEADAKADAGAEAEVAVAAVAVVEKEEGRGEKGNMAELAKAWDLQKTEGLGKLSFSRSQARGVVRISNVVMFMEIEQPVPVKPVASPGKVVTQEQLEDEEFPPLLFTCSDPETSGKYIFRLTQGALRGLEALKGGGREAMVEKERRPELAKFMLKKAGSIFHLGEKQGRVQLCLKGETDEDKVQERNKSKDAVLEKLEMAKRSQEAQKRRVQNECRVVRLEEFRLAAAKKRAKMERRMLISSVREWQGMHGEDVTSGRIRAYLTCDAEQLGEIELAFEIFDADGSGTITGSEFQALCFELGEMMDDRQTKEAVDSIDLDGNGVIQFYEFATWWVTDKPTGVGSGDTTSHKMLAMKLKMLKRAKAVYGKMGIFGGGPGGGGTAKEKRRQASLKPLNLKRPQEGDGGRGGAGPGRLGKWFGGGGGKGDGGSRPTTI